MQTKITLNGKIGFEPVNRTKKHNNQASWKRIAMVFFDGDVCEYYAWFIKKRFNLELNKPLRGAHVSFINDSIKELSCNNTKTIEQINSDWERVKNKWDKKIIPVTFDLDVKFGEEHWWLMVPHDERELLHGIRAELGLPKPFFGLHMSIGRAREGVMGEHNEYITNLMKSGFIK